LDQGVSGAVDVEVGGHRFAFRQPAATASASVQNHCSPFAVLIFVRS
jgi:hypothetical protein